MKYTHVYIDALGYELAPNVITSEYLEQKLRDLYQELRLKPGQLESLTGIRERRWWDIEHTMHDGAIRAARKALHKSSVAMEDIGTLIYSGVCRDNIEPATACAVANGLAVGSDTEILDISNACLGVINGIRHVANAIELGQIRAGLVVSCESARQIVEHTITEMLDCKNMDVFRKKVATLTGGSGAAAVLLTHSSVSRSGHRLIGSISKNAVQYHNLCRWGPDTGMPASGLHVMETEPVLVLEKGVALGIETYNAFKTEFGLEGRSPDKIICHQVGYANQQAILKALGIDAEKDFCTYPFLGNMGTVSLPITAAIAEEREFLEPNDLVGFFGIGSGLNCMMLAVDW